MAFRKHNKHTFPFHKTQHFRSEKVKYDDLELTPGKNKDPIHLKD